MFNELTAWRFKPEQSDFIDFFSDDIEKRTAREIAYVLNEAIIPSLSMSDLNQSNFDKLLSFYCETQTHESLTAFIYFVAQNKSFAPVVEKFIREGLYTQNLEKIAASSFALVKWCELNSNDQPVAMISRLIYSINPNQTIGLTVLINSAAQLYELECLSKGNIESLVEVLPMIFDSTNYENIDPLSRLAISVTFVRAAYVKLARQLLEVEKEVNSELRRVIDQAKADPLPEVRFA